MYTPKISPWKLFCAPIAANDVRLLEYRTVKIYTPKKQISGYAPDKYSMQLY